LKLCPELKAKHERLQSKPVPVLVVEKPLTLIHPNALESIPDVKPLTTDVVCTPPTNIVYTEYTNSIYQKYAGRDWADITDSDEE
jgi:hypothetical protein